MHKKILGQAATLLYVISREGPEMLYLYGKSIEVSVQIIASGKMLTPEALDEAMYEAIENDFPE